MQGVHSELGESVVKAVARGTQLKSNQVTSLSGQNQPPLPRAWAQ